MGEGIISTKSICKLMLLNKDIANPFQVNVPFLYPLSRFIVMEQWLEMG